MDSDLVGVGEAAQILGMSRTSLQKLVDGGHLAAIKTAGGHRRISRESLRALGEKMGLGAVRTVAASRAAPAPVLAKESPANGKFTVLLVEDDEVQIALVTTLVQRHFPQIVLQVARDGLDAVLQLERIRPHLIITDLKMEPFDGFRLLQLIHSKPEYAGMALLVMSSLSAKEIDKRGGLPAGVVFYRKPLNAERLTGYLDAHVQLHRP